MLQDPGVVAPSLRWRAETNKQRTERVAPLNKDAHAAIQRLLKERPGIGDAPMFPRADDPMRPISRHVAYDWLRRAEKLAGLEHIDGLGWHGNRRTWATARKHLSAVDVAAAGGWAGPHTLQTVYQQADLASMVHVVEHPAELREAKQA